MRWSRFWGLLFAPVFAVKQGAARFQGQTANSFPPACSAFPWPETFPNAMPNVSSASSVSSALFRDFFRAFKARLPLLAAALWWGSGMGLGFVAAPLLIRHAASVPQAAAFTLEIFQAQTWLALACGVALLLTRPRAPQPPDAALVGLAALGMLLALLVQHAAAPRIAAREPLWHAAGALLYAGQCLCAGVLLWRLARQPGG